MPALGFAVYLIPLYLGILAWQFFSEDGPALPVGKAIGCAVLVLTAAAALALAHESTSGVGTGGWLGGFVATELKGFLGMFGAVIITGALLVLSFQLLTNASLPALVAAARRGGVAVATARLPSSSRIISLPSAKSSVAFEKPRARHLSFPFARSTAIR